MEFRLLGPLEVCSDGELIVLAGPKQRAILTILLLDANQVVPRARLLAEVWGERAPGSEHSLPPGSEHSLDVHISRLRKAPAPGGDGNTLIRRVRHQDDPDSKPQRAERPAARIDEARPDQVELATDTRCAQAHLAARGEAVAAEHARPDRKAVGAKDAATIRPSPSSASPLELEIAAPIRSSPPPLPSA